jgi:4-amino-4-deoxy-L-arabinose transferase-like glycosyltransferase
VKLEDMKHERRKRVSSCFMVSCFILLSILQFCLFLNHRDITTAHEGRVAATAQEMLGRHGWLVPYCNGVPRIVKPPLAYWAAMIAWSVAGQIDVWLARLPAALLGAIAVVLVMDLGRRVLGRQGGIISGLVWISTWFIVDEYRKAMADPYLAFFTLLSVWAWVAADERAYAKTPSPRGADLLYLLCYLSAGVAAMAKGHLILLHLALAIIPYQWLKRRPPAHRGAQIIGIALMLLVGVPWFIYVIRTVPHSIGEWTEDGSGAYGTIGLKFSAWFHYFVNLPLTAAPWTAFLIIGLLIAIFGKRRRDRRAVWPAIWLGLTVLVFTCVPMKKNAYLLPMMPAQTLVVAAAIASVLRSRKPIDRFLIAAHAIAAAGALCVVLFFTLRLEPLEIEPPAPMMAAAAVGIFLLIGARSLSPRLMSMRTVVLIGLGFALATHGVESWLFPDFDNRRSDRTFALHVTTNVAADKPLYLIGDGMREDVLFYLHRTVTVVPSVERIPPDYNGYALVTADRAPEVRLSKRADELGESADRSPRDKLFLLRFPRDLTPRQSDR